MNIVLWRRSLLRASFCFYLLCHASAFAFYNPNTGKWLSRDPIGDQGFNVILTKGPDTNDLEMKHMLETGLESFRRRDLLTFSTWLKMLHDRQQISQKPYATVDHEERSNEYALLYVFNQNRTVDQIDNLGLFSMKFWYPCFNPCCKLWPVCEIYHDSPRRFPRQPFALAVCLSEAMDILKINCIKCHYGYFDFGCEFAKGCFDSYW
jgi:hypothetical protein